MKRIDEEMVKAMCQDLGLVYEYDALHAEIVFKRRTNPEDTRQCIEYCFGEEEEFTVPIYKLKGISPGYFYQKLIKAFPHD